MTTDGFSTARPWEYIPDAYGSVEDISDALIVREQNLMMSSNAGQVLWGGILSQPHAESVARHLMTPAMFSGWGIRTLANDAAPYNPLGYHVGTIWPHDNAITAAGPKRYGVDDAVEAIFTGLFDAVKTWPDFRLPELFGGHPRGLYSRPVPYPVACRPQAWTSGAWFHLIQTTLGVHTNGQSGEVSFARPRLPSWIGEMDIAGVRLANTTSHSAVRRVNGEITVSINGERIMRGNDDSFRS